MEVCSRSSCPNSEFLDFPHFPIEPELDESGVLDKDLPAVTSAENSPVSGQNPLLSWESAVLTKKISAAKIKKSDRRTDIFIRSPASAGVAAKCRNSFGDIFHHH